MKYTGLQIVGFVVAVILALVAAVFLMDIAVRAAQYGMTTLGFGEDDEQSAAFADAEVNARDEGVPGRVIGASEIPSSYAAPSETVPSQKVQTKSVNATPKTQEVPRSSHAVMNYDSFGTIWRGSFVPRTTIARDETPAIRVVVNNRGNAATGAWTLSCNWEGDITTTNETPLAAHELAFVVCGAEELPQGVHTVTLVYKEAGKPAQSQNVSVRVE